MHSVRCGNYRILQLSPKTAVPRASTRLTRENGAINFAETARQGAFFVSNEVAASTEKYVLFAIAQDNMFRVAEQAVLADDLVGHLAVN